MTTMDQDSPVQTWPPQVPVPVSKNMPVETEADLIANEALWIAMRDEAWDPIAANPMISVRVDHPDESCDCVRSGFFVTKSIQQVLWDVDDPDRQADVSGPIPLMPEPAFI